MPNTAQDPTISIVPFRKVILWGLFGFLLVLPAIQLLNVDNLQTSHFFTFVWVVSAFFLVAALATVRGSLSFAWHPIFLTALAWLGIKIVSSLFSLSFANSLFGDYGTWTDGVIFLFIIFLMVELVLMLKLSIKEIKILVNLFLVQSLIIGVLGLDEAYHANILHHLVRINSYFGVSDYLSAYGLLFLPLSFILFVTMLRASPTLKSKRWMAFYGIHGVVLGIALFLTVPNWPQAPKLAVNSPTAQDSTLANPSLAERLTGWRVGLNIGAHRPWLGTGPGTTRLGFFLNQKSGPIKGWSDDVVVNRPYNDLVEQFSQTGIIGLVAYFAFLVLFTKAIWRYRLSIKQDLRPYALGIVVGLLLFFVSDQFAYTFIYAGIVWWIWVALLLAMAVPLEWNMLFDLSAFGKLAVGTLVICLVLTVYWSLRYVQADQLTPSALTALYQHDYMKASQLQSQAVVDYPYENYYSEVLASIYYDQFINERATKKVDPNTTKKMVATAQEAAARNPYKPLDAVNKGAAEYLASKPQSKEEIAAVRDVDYGINLNKWYYLLWFKAGQAFEMGGDKNRAKNYFNAALQLNPPERYKITIQKNLAIL